VKRTESGSAIVEVVWLGILLLIPMVWIVLSVFEVQRGAFGVTAAARSAGRAYALAPDDVSGEQQATAAAAVAMADGPARGLAMMDGIAAGGALDGYPYLHSARADLLRRLDRRSEAATAYRRALELTSNTTERTFLEGRLAEVGAAERTRRPD